MFEDDSLHALLGQLARPFVDHNPQDVVRWLAEQEAKRRGIPYQSSYKPKKSQEVLEFDGLNPPDLTHTNAMILTVDGVMIGHRWNPCLRELANRLPPTTNFDTLIAVKFEIGKSADPSMGYCAQADISIQYQDANRAWRTIVAIAQHLGHSVQADFKWPLLQNGKQSAYPGQAGRLILTNS